MATTPPHTPGPGDGRPTEDLAGFAEDLRALRVAAGAPSYATLARRTGVPRSTLHDALGGERFPSLDTVVALVETLGGDAGEWRDRWTAVRLATEAGTTADPADPAAPGGPRARSRGPLRWWVAAGAVAVLVAVGLVIWSPWSGDCVQGERYVVSAAGDLIDAQGAVMERLDQGETVVVVDKHPPEYRSRYRAVSDRSGDTGYVDESKIDPRGDACD